MTTAAKRSFLQTFVWASRSLALLTCALPSFAQSVASDPSADNGTHWYGTYDGVNDRISVSSGNVSFCIPLVSLKGPNKHDVSIPLCYNSEFEEAYTTSNGQLAGAGAVLSYFPWQWATNTPSGYTTPPMGPGWSLTGAPAYYGAPATSANGGLTLFMPDGARYSFINGSAGPDGQNADIYNGYFNGSQTFTMKDGTRWSLVSAGSSSCPSLGCALETFPDTGLSGIYWTNNSVTDFVGRTVTEDSGAYFTGSGTTSSSVLVNFRYPDSNGTTRTATIQMTTMQFTCSSNPSSYPGPNGTYNSPAYSMPTAIILPDGLTYTFQYDNCGMLRKVTYPTGGYARYDYSLQPQSFCPQHEGCGIGYYIYQIAAKHVCPAPAMTLGATSASSYSASNQCSVPEESTTYSPTPYINTIGNGNSENIVTDPVGNYTVYQFSAPNSDYGYPALETSRQMYNVSQSLLRTVTTQYSTTATPGSTLHGGTYPALPTIQTTTLDNGMVSQTQWSYDLWNTDGNDSVLTEKRVFDYGSGAPGPLLKRTDYDWLHRDDPADYGWSCGVSCPTWRPMHICDKKTSETVYDGSGKLIAQTKYVYDNNDPSAYGAVGPPALLTSASTWRSTDGAWLTTSYQYNGLYGNVTKKTDPNGYVTNYSYSDNYSDGVNRNSNAFLTMTTDPLNHVTKSQYYWGTGLVAATCGENFSGSCATGLSSGADYASYTYDLIGREISKTTGDGGQSTNCFSELGGTVGQSSCSNQGYPLQVMSIEMIASGTTKSSAVILDGEGKTTRSELLSDPSCPSGTVNVDTTYDQDERKYTVTNPYCSTNPSAPTSGTTTYAYDGLSRVTQVMHPDGTSATNTYTGRAVLSADEGNGTGTNRVQRISQTDAMGRLINVCEVTGHTQQGNSGAPLSSCSLDISGGGFLTVYGYDASGSNGPLENLTSVIQGGVVRNFVYDSLGELRSAANPESGTTAYNYDYDENLISKTSPLENQQSGTVTTTYGYDHLNRLLSKSYSDGTTPSACFQYDQTTSIRGVGRLTTEWTQATGACPSTLPSTGVLTQRTFAAYDSLGRVTADEQCGLIGNCTGGSPYSLTYGYDLAGDVTSFNNGLAGIAALSFTGQYNSAGRLSMVNGSASPGGLSTPLFMATGYTPAGALSNAQIGLGANDSGIAFHRDYNSRLLPTDEVDTVGQTPGSATVQITGSEQSGSSYGPGYTYGSVTFTGAEQCPSSGCDDGAFLIFIGSQQGQQYSSPHQINYGQFDTPESLAIGLAEEVNCSNSPVVAYAVGPTVYFVSCSASNTAYSLSAGLTGYRYEGQYSPSFSVTASGSSLTSVTSSFEIPGYAGNTNSTSNAVSFYGTEQSGQTGAFVFFVFANSVNNGPPIKTITSVNWGASSTPSTLASALAAAFPACSASNTTVTAAVDSSMMSGPTVLLSSCNTTTSYIITGEVAGYNPEGSNTTPSFIALTSGSWPGVTTASEGPTPIYDSGIVSLLVNGTQIATTSYGSSSTPTSIASALVSNGANNGVVTLSASGAHITITGIGDGSITDYSYQVTSSSAESSIFTSPSFSGSPGSGSLAGATNAPLYNWAISSYAPNGDVLSMTDSVMGTWSYAYDDFNRLTSGSATAGVDNGLALGWTYDRYGNRWAQNATGSGNASATQPQLSFGNTNQVSGWSYDGAGNLLNDGRNSYNYDAEGRVCAVQNYGGSFDGYLYDAEGRRVAKTGITSFNCALSSNGYAVTGSYLLGLGGEQVTEFNNTGTWVHSNVWSGGKLLGTYEGTVGPHPATWHFHLTDWLGTKRMQTTAAGNNEEVCYSYPFGDGLTCTGSDATEHHFTGKERDNESGIDYFGARYYTSDLGRWMSPDSLNLTDDRVLNPANTLNKYAYGADNPLTYTDPDGKDITLFYESPTVTGSFPFVEVGHIMILAENQANGQAAAMSFGPVHDSEYGFTGLGSPVNSTKAFDSTMTVAQLRENFSSLTIQTTPEEAQKVIEFIHQLSTSVDPYKLVSTNCTTVCRDALKIIGLLPKDDKDWTPKTFWQHMFGEYADPYWQNGFGWYLSDPGTDYGNPTPGFPLYSPYDLLEILWQEDDNSSVTTTQGPVTPCGDDTGNPCS
jgi:RHS repeat-associated protein